MKNKVHKTCPTWGETQCGVELFQLTGRELKTIYRWCDVTCKKCLKQKTIRVSQRNRGRYA
jgi:hypothetical protein